MDQAKAQRAIEDFLQALGVEPGQTGQLVAEAWCGDLLEGQGQDARAILREGALEADGGGVVVLRDLSVTTMCPHHLMVAHGRGDVVFRPGDRVAGFGAIARALRACTRKLTLQETAGAEMASALIEALGATGAVVRLRLTHTCLVARGARESGALIESLAIEGDSDLLLSVL